MTPVAGAAARSRDPRAEAAPRRPGSGGRRVSGSGRAAVADVGGAVAAPPLRTLPRPARSAPAHPVRGPAEAVGRLCDSRLLERLVRGRFWIGFVAFALIGIVAMQLALLKLNTGIGRDLRRETQLQRQNADMEAEVSGLASVDRVQAQAALLGMVPETPGSVRFLSAGSSPARRAAAALDAAAASSASSSSASATSTPASASTSTAAAPTAAAPVASGPAPATPTVAPSPAMTGAPSAPPSSTAAPPAAASTPGSTSATGAAPVAPAASSGGASAPVVGG